jgi:NAD(P)-dependent dehydrogenase (short-subunit alcohol dehydrogenase family)
MSSSIGSEFAGKSALVTGGTSGIGRVTAIELARRGAHVTITGRRAAEGEAAAAEIRKAGAVHGIKAQFVQGDVTREDDVRKAVDAAVALTGRLDIAFNNAGIELANVPTTESTPEQYRQIMDINVLGVLLSMKHELRAILAHGKGGAIVNNASIAGSIAMPGVGIYVASKHAVLGLTKSAALEVAKQGVRVNAVSPGGIDTDMLSRFTGGKQKEMMDWMAGAHPIGRIGHPEEIAKAVLFLLSDAASFVTGHDLKVDGAFTAQ